MIPEQLQNLRLPIIAAPMFTVSYPELVIAQCCSGIVGSFPST
jgi:nitronate monooxygenase